MEHNLSLTTGKRSSRNWAPSWPPLIRNCVYAPAQKIAKVGGYVCCAVCDVTGARWHFYASSNSFNGIVPPKPVGSRWLSMWSLDECLQVCSGDLRCFAADFDMETRVCYVHHRADFADTRGPYPNVHQFVVAQRCRPGKYLSLIHI